MKKVLYILFFILCTTSFIISQDAKTIENLKNSNNSDQVSSLTSVQTSLNSSNIPNPQLAMSTADYKVTAGDIYTLGYAAGTTPVVYQILVDTSYKIRVSNLAVIDVENKTYLELKTMVEAIVTKNYPFSGVQFVLLSPASFNVSIKGEVDKTVEKKAWGLTRLSSVLTDNLTEYSSLRDVAITSVNGTVRKYDVFKAARFGDFSQDPYLRPGDVVTVKRFSRSVTLNGAVERPGVYQLLDGEGLSELVQLYGSGLIPLADANRIELVRYVESDSPLGNKIFLTAASIFENYTLQNFDIITVSLITELLPVMFVEGAITVKNEIDVSAKVKAEPDTSTRFTVQFNTGENYASLIRRNRFWFSAVSDTANSYILRKGERILINLNPMLYDANYISDYLVEENDTLIVPFRQYFVMVSGAVDVPGRYPYIPDRDWSYYVALAGGFDPLRNSRATVIITDITGKTLKKTDAITPETNIEASNNAFLYYFNQYAPVVTTLLSVVTTVFTVIAVTGK